MLNKNHVAEIRTCERIKFDQALYILTMYQKKIRNQVKFDGDKPLDIEKQYDQKIVRSWNGKWKMDLTKPLLNCVTSVSPRVILDICDDEKQMRDENQIDRYNNTMLKFIRRMRAQHEDQSNFKLTQVDINQKNIKAEKFIPYAKTSFEDYLKAIQSILESMNSSIQKNEGISIEEHDGDNYFLQIGIRIQQILQLTTNLLKNHLSEDLIKFISICSSTFDSIKQSQQGSTLIAVQPKLDQFTYILNPLFFPIYTYLLKEKDEHKSKMQAKQVKEDKGFPFKNFFSANTTSLSKFVFINLDGYQSQFNLQFARCFRKNMLYISFPKQDIHFANDMNSVYQQRLYKKIMYNWQKNKMSFSANTMDSQMNEADKMYFITHNIEDYYGNVQKILYKFETNFEDLNKNIFIFPLRLNTLNQNFNNLVPQDEDDTIELYQSYAILQIFKYFLVNQIKQFCPTFIVVSHSGRLNIQDNHFVQIMQQLTKLSHYKVVYFPNLTTRFCPKQKKGIDHEINIQNIDYLQRPNQQQDFNNQQLDISFDFFNKISRFLKVSSGTHSLVKNFEQQDIISKHRNLKVLKRINKLMEVLGHQYENIERIRFKSTQIQLIPKLYQKDVQKIVKAFEKLVPTFYVQLYQLLQSIFTLYYTPYEKKALEDVKRYNMNPETIKNNYIIKDLLFFIESKIIVRNARNQTDKQLQSFEKIKKYLQCQRQKHFLQISQQRYEDSILIHFKTAKNSDIYDTINEGKTNLSGLVDISFTNPNKDIKQCMNIYDSTQIHYRLDQSQANATGSIPILIMNHLPLEKKNNSKFDNYCAFLNRDILTKLSNGKGSEQGVEKIYEQKKIKPYLIKFYDDQNNEIIQNKFQFRVQWNYCQTLDYMILYWPQLFNFVEAIAHKLQGKNYEPPLLNQFFIGKKQVKNDVVIFYRTIVPDDLAPRTGCSAYQFRNFAYILGGFYDKSNNYLQLQRDITMVNLDQYNHEQNRKIQIVNLKNQLYQPIVMKNVEQKQREKQKQKQKQKQRPPNSYIRPRRQFQFFSMEDLNSQYEAEEGIRVVAMIGGVGQNFIHPFSLLTYYYYEIRIQEESGNLLSIRKQIVYNRSIPVNLSRPSKNMGIIKTPIRSKNQANGKAIIIKPQLTEPHSYARFRIVYKIEEKQLKYKFQYVFSEKDCKMLKQQLRKCQQEKYQVSDISNFRIQKIQGMNNVFMTEKPGYKQLVHLRLEVEGMTEQKQQQYKLTQQSVSFLSIINGNYICAIVKHPIFTLDKSVLAQCRVKNIENENLIEDEAAYVSLRPIQGDLKGDLTLHIIQASNANLIYVLHGHRLYNSNKIYQYQITHNRKSGLKLILEIKPKKEIEYFKNKSIPTTCFSTFFYKKVDNIKNQIVCESYLRFEEDKNTIVRVCQHFDPSDLNNMCWVFDQPIRKYVFCIGNANRPISLDRIQFLDFFRQDKIRLIIVEFSKKKYVVKINEGQQQMMSEDAIVIMLAQANQLFIRSLQQQECERGTILFKKPVHYFDRGYDKND